jgi:hypothetical protein
LLSSSTSTASTTERSSAPIALIRAHCAQFV